MQIFLCLKTVFILEETYTHSLSASGKGWGKVTSYVVSVDFSYKKGYLVTYLIIEFTPFCF